MRRENITAFFGNLVSGAATFVDIQVGRATHVRYENIVSLRQTNKAATTASLAGV